MAKNLLLFTYSFPYGTSEPFLETEILLLSAHYDRIGIIPAFKSAALKRELPANVEVLDISAMEGKRDRISVFRHLSLILHVFYFQFLNSKRKYVYIKQFRFYLSYLTSKINFSKDLYALISESKFNNAVCYSYWFDYSILPLSILKKQKKIPVLVTRAHGGDVYEYQHYEKDFFFPFRSFQVKKIDKICPVSLDGLSHLKSRYAECEGKLVLSRLGVRISASINPGTAGVPVIVSCSSFFAYKRIELIIEILGHFKGLVKWIHIGNEGNLRDQVMGLSKNLPSNVEVAFLGQLSNKDVMSFYEATPVSLFLNVSNSEGLPVSIMEAISYGIPVVATDVGGVREMVGPETGSLIPKDFSPREVAMMIENNLAIYSEMEFRKKVRSFGINNFSSEINYSKFIQEVLRGKL